MLKRRLMILTSRKLRMRIMMAIFHSLEKDVKGPKDFLGWMTAIKWAGFNKSTGYRMFLAAKRLGHADLIHQTAELLRK